MKQKTALIILSGIIAFVVLILLLKISVFEPWVREEIQTSFNKTSPNYTLNIGKVHISIIKLGVELENIALSSTKMDGSTPLLTGKIASVKIKGINLFKVIFKNDIDISEIRISKSSIIGKLPFPKKVNKQKVSPINIGIDSLMFDDMLLEIKDDSSAQAYSIKDGNLKIYGLQLTKHDTVSPKIISQFDFNAKELITVLPDSMYTIAAVGTSYSATSKTLEIGSFSIQPNYTDYEFTSKYQFEVDRFEARLSHIFFHNFSAENYIQTRNLTSSFIEIGDIDLKAFRDKRKAFRHVPRPTFQEIIYNYPGRLHIDSLGILSGSITYTEHAEKANEPGYIRFTKINARIYAIYNDTLYKTKKAFLEFKVAALLMDKGKMEVLLKGRLFDNANTFDVNGTLLEMEAMELNPILEKNAFLFATSGKITTMNFSFMANNTSATGKMKLLYRGLDIAIKNKQTDDTTAIKERVISVIANMKMKHSNPMPGEKVRVGIIDNERDPEKFLFNYCFKSILSGIETSLVKPPKKKKK